MFDIKSRLFSYIRLAFVAAMLSILGIAKMIYTPVTDPAPYWMYPVLLTLLALFFLCPLFDVIYRRYFLGLLEADRNQFSPQGIADWNNKWASLVSRTRAQRFLDSVNQILVSHSTLPIEAENELIWGRDQVSSKLNHLKDYVMGETELIGYFDAATRDVEKNPQLFSQYDNAFTDLSRKAYAAFVGAQVGHHIMRCTATLQEIAHKYGYAATA
jgi:hypothetical protein